MTDRDTPGANSPEPDDVPREPSKAELDDAIRANHDDDDVVRDADDVIDAELPGEDAGEVPVAPAVDPDVVEERKTYPPSRFAVIAGGVLTAIMLVLTIITLTQDTKAYLGDYNRAVIGGLTAILEDQDVAEFNDDEVEAAQDAWDDAGAQREMTFETAAAALNAAKPDSVTPTQIEEALDEVEGSLPTLEGVEDTFRNQALVFGVVAVLMALGTVLYQRGKTWARMIAMFVSGFIGVMYLMQVLQGAFNIISTILVVASVAAFWAFMKGRLDDPPMPPPRPGRPGRGGGLFAPRSKQ